jgi:putative intracellular protease/amidase
MEPPSLQRIVSQFDKKAKLFTTVCMDMVVSAATLLEELGY